jgi:copper transport protein
MTAARRERAPLLLAGMFLLLAWLMGPPPAGAHAELVAAEPPPGARLEEAPPLIRLTFNEPLAAGSSLAVRRPDFSSVAGVEVAIGARAPEEMAATLPPLEPGIYTVQWDVVSQDGHTVSGAYQFSVGAAAAGQQGHFGWIWLPFIGTMAAALLVVAWYYRRIPPGFSRRSSP